MILPIAEMLKIPSHRVYANQLLFDSQGNYSDFDTNIPTSRDGGKKTVVQHLIDVHGYRQVIMIGDGATDMQARPPAAAFVGYVCQHHLNYLVKHIAIYDRVWGNRISTSS